MIGSIIAPPLIVALNQFFGWRVAFLVPATFGVIWVVVWRWINRDSGTASLELPAGESFTGSLSLLAYRQTWALMICRFLVGPVMQFYWYWMPDYLYTERRMSLIAIGAFSWLPYVLGDLGSITGGWTAGRLLSRGYSVWTTRRTTMLIGSVCCLGSLGVVAAPNASWAIAIIGIVLFGHTFFSANMFASINDLFPEAAVGRVTGLTGISGGLGGILFPLLTGYLVEHYSYAPAFLIAAILPLAAMAALWLLAPGMKPADLKQ